jgi:arsenate reductase (thioredoxin)
LELSVMKPIITLSLVALCLAGCSTAPKAKSADSSLLPPLRSYVDEVAANLDSVPAERKAVLGEIAATMAKRLEDGHDANVTFICTHNSRRSHMSQIWAQTAARYYGLDKVHAYSGGTEATCCNPRTITAMRRAGFTVEDATAGDNPLYLIRYAEDRPPIRAYSKLYNADENPKDGFIALMTCSKADQTCPVVQGAVARYAIHYADPKVCDDLPTEAAAYNERCREIAREMFYIMSQVRKQTGAATHAEVAQRNP